jgi:signal transduction histidine kinase
MINSMIYIVISLMFILGMAAFLFVFFKSIEERRKMQQIINQKLNEKEIETAQRIAGEFLHQKLINERFVPHAHKLEELESLLKTLESPQTNLLIEKTQELLWHLQETKEMVRDRSRTIFPPFLSYLFIETCQRHLDELQSLYPNNAKIVFKSEGDFKDLNSTLLYNLYNIMDLFVTNSFQHAEAQNIYISFKHNANSLVLSMHDDGNGFSLKDKITKTKGIGLADIQGKANIISPQFIFHSALGKGTQFEISLAI